jgi:hypothetical protein
MSVNPPAKSNAKYHHFVAVMHGRRFTDQSGRFYFFDKRVGKLLYTTPGHVFGQNHLNTVKDESGTKDVSVETRFSALEGRANLITERIVSTAREDQCPDLTAEEKSDWDQYLYLQYKRVPDVHSKVALFQEDSGAFEKLLEEHDVGATYTPEERARLIQAGKVRAIEMSLGPALEEFDKRGLVVGRIKGQPESFIIGSSPVIMAGDLREKDAQRWLPIASDVIVGIGGERGAEELKAIQDAKVIAALNRTIADQSTSFAAEPGALVAELIGLLPPPGGSGK